MKYLTLMPLQHVRDESFSLEIIRVEPWETLEGAIRDLNPQTS